MLLRLTELAADELDGKIFSLGLTNCELAKKKRLSGLKYVLGSVVAA